MNPSDSESKKQISDEPDKKVAPSSSTSQAETLSNQTDPPSVTTNADESKVQREKEEDCKEEPSPKRMRTDEEATNKDETEILDVCEMVGLKAGDRLEVEWQLVVDNGEGETGEGKTVTRWWGCTLLEFDGRTDDGVAIRKLDYDPYPEGGFPERSQEEVVFLTHDIIISPGSHAEFRYRPEGLVTFSGEEETREAINRILMSAFEKHSASWNMLDRAQQLKIASGIAKKKEELIQAIMSHSKSPVIGAEEMQEICQGVMAKR